MATAQANANAGNQSALIHKSPKKKHIEKMLDQNSASAASSPEGKQSNQTASPSKQADQAFSNKLSV